MNLASALLFAVALPAAAQYELTSWTVDAGGGQSIGGIYAIHGTIGQLDANIHTGGADTLFGGFWTPIQGAPLLRILRENTRVVLAWPDPSTGYRLQVSPSLSAPLWTDVFDAPSIVGSEKQVTQLIVPGARFFRLRNP